MAIYDIKESRFVSGNFSGSKYKMTVEYDVYTNSILDGPDTIRRDDTFRLGKEYSFGKDYNPKAFLVSVSVANQRKVNSGTEGSPNSYWKVQCEFETAGTIGGGGGDGGGGDGGGDDSPSEDEPEEGEDIKSGFQEPYVEILFKGTSEVIERAKWIRTITVDQNLGTENLEPNNSFNKYHAGKFIGPVCSSAFVPKVPAPERTVVRPIIRLSGNVTAGEMLRWINEMSALTGCTNTEPYTIVGPRLDDPLADQFRKPFDPFTLKIVNISVGKYKRNFNMDLTQVVIEFEVDYDLHYIWDLDQGYARLSDVGTFNTRAFNKNPEVELLRDERGSPLQEPVLLDGLGEVLRKSKATNGNKDKMLYHAWADPLKSKDFNTFAILKPGAIYPV